MAIPPKPISPSQAAANIKKRREEDLKKAAKGGGNPNLIADPNNPLWQISFKYIAAGSQNDVIAGAQGVTYPNVVSFPGWVTSFVDSLSSTWKEETVYGRMDPLVTFQRTQRTISMSFDIVASNLFQAMANTGYVDELMGYLYPTYNEGGFSDSNTLKAAPLIKVRWANLVKGRGRGARGGHLGYIDGFSYQPDFASGFFLQDGEMFPQLLRINFNLKVIHTALPGWDGSSHPAHEPGVTDHALAADPERTALSGYGLAASGINVSELEQQKRQLLETQAQEKLVLQNVNRDFTAQGGRPPRRGPAWHRARKDALEQYRTNPSAFSNLWGE